MTVTERVGLCVPVAVPSYALYGSNDEAVGLGLAVAVAAAAAGAAVTASLLPTSAAVVLNRAFKLSERSWFAAAAARPFGVFAGTENAGSTMVRLPNELDVDTLRGGSGSRLRLSGTVVCARTSSMETSLAGRYPLPCVVEETRA